MQYPKDFLKNVYEAVRAKGGVCIADEVNTICKALSNSGAAAGIGL